MNDPELRPAVVTDDGGGADDEPTQLQSRTPGAAAGGHGNRARSAIGREDRPRPLKLAGRHGRLLAYGLVGNLRPSAPRV